MTAFKAPDVARTAPYTAPSRGGLFIDTLTANQGYVTVGYVGKKCSYDRLKFQVRQGRDETYNYDFHPLEKPMRVPMNMGHGHYLFRVMERIEGNYYAQVMATERDVKLISRFVPYTIPTVFCNYDVQGPCVRMARYVTENCATELDALSAVTKWVAGYVSYDYDKAKGLSGKSGYVPKPDQTLKERRGICFDYASMEAAMLRSLDIPCKVVTGYVNEKTYHSWVVAYADGKWRRRDPTFTSVLSKTGSNVSLSTYTYKNRFVY